MWEKDSQIDPDNLHTESLKVPALHAKYHDMFNNFLLLRKKQFVLGPEVQRDCWFLLFY